MPKTSCTRCGTCCRKGGPALHIKDTFLFEEGRLTLADLCTYRAGELVRDQQKGGIAPLPEEIVKIAPLPSSDPYNWICRFFKEGKPYTLCALHGKHPAECRAFFCEKPEELLALGAEDRLDRAACIRLANAPAWYAELIAGHEETCAYAKLTNLAEKLDTNAAAREEFLEILAFDKAYRELLLEKKAVPEEELNFLLGRPLLDTIVMYDVEVAHGPRGLMLRHINHNLV